MTEPKDRVLSVTASTTYNGIDFVAVTAPRTLVVHFLNTVAVADPSMTVAITGGDSVPTVAVKPIAAADWTADAEGRPLLTLTALTDGDFSNYTLTITAPKLDLILDTTVFSFKATCPSDFDCAPPPTDMPAERRAGAADRLSVARLPEHSAGVAGLFLAALSQLGRTLGSRFRHDDVRAAVGRRRRIQLSPGSGRRRSEPPQRDAAAFARQSRAPRRLRADACRQRHHHPAMQRLGAGHRGGGNGSFDAGAGRNRDSVRDRHRPGGHVALSGQQCMEFRDRALLVRRQRAMLAGRRDRHVGAGPRFRLHRRPSAADTDRPSRRKPPPDRDISRRPAWRRSTRSS